MTDKTKNFKPVLGRGLGSLISSSQLAAIENSPIRAKAESMPTPANDSEQGIVRLSIESIEANPHQPRQDFAQSEIEELAQSIKVHGLIAPVVVRPLQSGQKNTKYQIVAGERRYRAAQQAGLKELPALIKILSDKEALQLAVVENVQRADLNPMELANSYHRLAEDFSMTQEQVAAAVGRDRASIANYTRLLRLTPQVQKMVRDGLLSLGHAKALLTVREPQAQEQLAKRVIDQTLSVRELEAITSRSVSIEASSHRSSSLKDRQGDGILTQELSAVLERLRRALGTRVGLRHHSSGKGSIVVDYFSPAELDRLVDKICT